MYVVVRYREKVPVNQNAACEFFCELREERMVLYKTSRPSGRVSRSMETRVLPFGRFFESFITGSYRPSQIENRIRNGVAIIIHPPRLQTRFPPLNSPATRGTKPPTDRVPV